jgi:hypothetical protein
LDSNRNHKRLAAQEKPTIDRSIEERRLYTSIDTGFI